MVDILLSKEICIVCGDGEVGSDKCAFLPKSLVIIRFGNGVLVARFVDICL